MKKNQKTQKPLFVRVVVELDSTERTLSSHYVTINCCSDLLSRGDVAFLSHLIRKYPLRALNCWAQAEATIGVGIKRDLSDLSHPNRAQSASSIASFASCGAPGPVAPAFPQKGQYGVGSSSHSHAHPHSQCIMALSWSTIRTLYAILLGR